MDSLMCPGTGASKNNVKHRNLSLASWLRHIFRFRAYVKELKEAVWDSGMAESCGVSVWERNCSSATSQLSGLQQTTQTPKHWFPHLKTRRSNAKSGDGYEDAFMLRLQSS